MKIVSLVCDSTRRGVYAQAAAARLAATVAAHFLPYRLWRPWLLAALHGSRPATRCDPDSVNLILSALIHVERFLPPARCLERALAAWLLLRRCSPARVRLGAGCKPGRELFAHAWLEVNGEVVLGGSSDPLYMLTDEPYTQPLLTRHEPLLALTGKTAEKSPATDKDPATDKTTDKDPTTDKTSDKQPSTDKSGT